MTLDERRLDSVLRATLAPDVQERVPHADASVLRAVRAKVARDGGRRGAPRHGRRLVWVLVAAVVALLLAAGSGLAAAVMTQRIELVAPGVWQQRFASEHGGQTGKGAEQGAQETTLAEAQQRAGFHVRVLGGVTGARLMAVRSATVAYPDGKHYPSVDLEYSVGEVRVIVTEILDPDPKAPFTIPNQLTPTTHVVTIDGSQYLFIADARGKVRDVQFKTTDGVVISINFFAPVASGGAPDGVDAKFAQDVVRHVG